MILDGWGYRQDHHYNAIAEANTPQWDEWWQNRPHMLIEASGNYVGLPSQQMGNSEVGHMHIGAGRLIRQDFTRINDAIETAEFANNAVLQKLIDDSKKSGKTLHVLGLLSKGGVHSHEKHLFAFLTLCAKHQLKDIQLHLFLDGRDTPPKSALESIEALEKVLEQHPVARIATISGRYFAMDRDKRWDRIAATYQVLTEGKTDFHFANAKEAILSFYQEGKTDEFIPPTLIGKSLPIKDGDNLFFFNFRADRARQLTSAFISKEFEGFSRQPLKLSHFVSMTSYAKTLTTEIAFPVEQLHNTLGEFVAKAGLSQLRIAETEKYAHVTFFFNGGSEAVFVNEDRILIPSPKVATYDLLPEMSAKELTRTMVEAINSHSYDLIICNYANADMVGHSGNKEATIKAIECLDSCMKEVYETLSKVDGNLIITADHGNAELMYDEQTKQAHIAHTTLPVPLVFVGDNQWQLIKKEGSLIDIAPTILALLNIPKPKEMQGDTLLAEKI